MKVVEDALYLRIVEILTDANLTIQDANTSNISDYTIQHQYRLTHQDSFIGLFVLYVSCVVVGEHIDVLGAVFNTSDKTIEFTGKDSVDNDTSKHKLQYIAEILNERIELARIHAI